MNNPLPNDPVPEPIAHAAAAWVLRCDRGLTAAEQDEFSQWLAHSVVEVLVTERRVRVSEAAPSRRAVAGGGSAGGGFTGTPARGSANRYAHGGGN